ncbi:AhpC/TSA family protein [Winogradskyella eximia]|jgi:thiol-disulfide isomerase/thioredoxin|uniref:AhpC/TSA family protein n=1 Tax=Winogradskyella eximia TaxID=262006 RepID=A0A3D9H4G1_9FLAO|nr:TlpA disulfide reductase family protein [Winogradskyella eximia]RED43816.1 AhpC/TSA family protein [Winogradskyella eximia]|tara:strand:- start:14894 stop:15364 length:471 start_codon:yes stop_codon:yes gene_type:complete
MKHLLLILLISVLPIQQEKLEVYDYDGLEPLIHKKDDKVHVVNFWATWCGPCVKELPYFEAINDTYKNENVEVLLVSLDFPSKYDSALKPFIKKNNLKSKVVALNDTDQNRWIPAINEDWSGALPATIIYKGDKRQFYERSFTKEELETELKQFLK